MLQTPSTLIVPFTRTIIGHSPYCVADIDRKNNIRLPVEQRKPKTLVEGSVDALAIQIYSELNLDRSVNLILVRQDNDGTHAYGTTRFYVLARQGVMETSQPTVPTVVGPMRFYVMERSLFRSSLPGDSLPYEKCYGEIMADGTICALGHDSSLKPCPSLEFAENVLSGLVANWRDPNTYWSNPSYWLRHLIKEQVRSASDVTDEIKSESKAAQVQPESVQPDKGMQENPISKSLAPVESALADRNERLRLVQSVFEKSAKAGDLHAQLKALALAQEIAGPVAPKGDYVPPMHLGIIGARCNSGMGAMLHAMIEAQARALSRPGSDGLSPKPVATRNADEAKCSGDDGKKLQGPSFQQILVPCDEGMSIIDEAKLNASSSLSLLGETICSLSYDSHDKRLMQFACSSGKTYRITGTLEEMSAEQVEAQDTSTVHPDQLPFPAIRVGTRLEPLFQEVAQKFASSLYAGMAEMKWRIAVDPEARVQASPVTPKVEAVDGTTGGDTLGCQDCAPRAAKPSGNSIAAAKLANCSRVMEVRLESAENQHETFSRLPSGVGECTSPVQWQSNALIVSVLHRGGISEDLEFRF
jgi:hypothetical protein